MYEEVFFVLFFVGGVVHICDMLDLVLLISVALYVI